MLDRQNKNELIRLSLALTRAKRKSQICKVYDLKIQYNSLSKRQKELLKMLFIESKWLWNDILNYCKEDPSNNPRNYVLSHKVKVKNRDGNFLERLLKNLAMQSQQSLVSQMISNIKTLSILKKNKIQNVGSLKFKSDFNWISLKQYGCSHKIVSKNKIKIQGIFRNIKVRGTTQIPLEFEYANARLIKNSLKDYHLKLTCYIDKNKLKLDTTTKSIGIDFGCSTAFTFSDGNKIKVSIKESEQLKKLQAMLATKIKGSNNRKKLILKIRKLHVKINNKKNDEANKIVSYLLNNYKYIAIQDEQILEWRELHGNAIQHSVLGRVKSKLVNSPKTHVINKYFPSSKTCSNCGHIKKDLNLFDRTFKCLICNYEEDRDINASKNILKLSNSGTERLKTLVGG